MSQKSDEKPTTKPYCTATFSGNFGMEGGETTDILSEFKEWVETMEEKGYHLTFLNSSLGTKYFPNQAEFEAHTRTLAAEEDPLGKKD